MKAGTTRRCMPSRAFIPAFHNFPAARRLCLHRGCRGPFSARSSGECTARYAGVGVCTDASAWSQLAMAAAAGGSDGAAAQQIPARLVVPGDSLDAELASIQQRVRVGTGVQQVGTEVLATQAGVLRHQLPNRVWVEHSSRRYVAKAEDPVIGIVTDADRAADGTYRVSLHGTSGALLPKLAFDGASKKNKPDLGIGAAVYCRVASASRFMEPELSCQVLSGPKKDWVTGEALFGELKGGLTTRCSTGLAHSLLDPEHVVLNALGKRLPFELAVGLNGMFWVNAAQQAHVVVITNALLNSEFLSPVEATAMTDTLLRKLL